ncbi:MAG TPA: 2-oxo-4-hydroxy-4-carboxy-5-ureidoimidazoline decarboxylase [Pyrinomonadaceae bacterium]|nr:2-oxo-4-hydroxy-4-carboxy-5-ureidoimidazoline decarboxylase [Pyrinomonadaceae bacterium]
MDAISRINSLTTEEAEAEFLKCCGCKRWAARLCAERPFENVEEMVATADRIWWSLDANDWVEAFDSHPKIGEQKAAAPVAGQALSWSETEQSGTRDSPEQTMNQLGKLNRQYQDKFGFIYIICATGKSADEMLETLRERLNNDRATELTNAAREQAKITTLRLNKLLGIQ